MEALNLSFSQCLYYIFTLICGYIIYEQLSFHLRKRGHNGFGLNGPIMVTPIIGGIISMIYDPYGFWERQRLFNPNGLSWTSILGFFTIFSTDATISKKILSENGPDGFMMAIHPNAKVILGDESIGFMHGKKHKLCRKSFLSLFTPRALGVYAPIQDQIIRDHLKNWLALNQPFEIRSLVRDLNLAVSHKVFLGDYLGTNPTDIRKFCDCYVALTDGFISAPIYFPGSGLWKAKRARDYVTEVTTKAVLDSQQAIKENQTPCCMVDFLNENVLEEIKQAQARNEQPAEHTTPRRLAILLKEFLFASQDASVASLVWSVALTSTYPEILKKIREEQDHLRPQNEPITYDLLTKMHYTRQVVKEILRYRPPAVMVPQYAMKDIPLTDTYTAPKGSLVMPSLWSACFQGFTDPEKFDPERMNHERQEDIKYRENFLTFGIGPHYCPGKQYAVQQLMCFLANISTMYEWKRHVNKHSDDVEYYSTIYPKDCIIELKERQIKEI